MTFQPVPLPDRLTQRGGDPGVLGKELLHIIGWAIANEPRSLQQRIGPSEIGHACARRIGYKLMGAPDLNPHQGVAWKPWVGTAVHARLEDVFDQWDYTRALASPGGYEPRWLTEKKVDVGRIGDEVIDGSTDLYDRVTCTVIDWKGLKIDTLIPTRDGWATIASLRPGDEVFDASGAICTVIRKSPVFQRDCYRITFDDGTTIVSDNLHEWPMLVGPACTPQLLSTETASRTVRASDQRAQRHLRIPNTSALLLQDTELPVPPYTLGAWLGDGHSHSGHIGKPDDELFEHIASEGFDVGPPTDKRGLTRNIRGLIRLLREADLLRNKHVPAVYLRGSFHQRLALLQGLMDTDGTWNKIRKETSFTSTDKALAAAVAELVATLGWKPRIWELTKHGFGRTITAYDVAFTPHDFNPFRLSRKADLVRLSGTTRSRRRLIRSIEPTMTVPTQCIEVDSPDHTYLCSEAMIPTHNCVGPTPLKDYRANGPGPQYRSQGHLYGRGWQQRGLPVDTVMIAFLPRNDELHKAHIWHEPYDEQVALDALARANAIKAATDALGVTALQQLPTADAYCYRCPYFKDASTDLRLGCPGHPGSQTTPTPALTMERKELTA